MLVLRVGLRLSQAAMQRAAFQALPGVAVAARRQLVPYNLVVRSYSSQPVADQSKASAASKATPNSQPPSAAPEKSVVPKDAAEVKEAKEEAAKPTLWQKVKHEAKHYWEGTKLLGYEIRVSSKLALKLASGRELSRREDRQLKRTVEDIVRIVPFSVFVLVPFAELLLPIALKLFPNLLPSTYETSSARTNKTKKLGDTRSRVGAYLRNTMHSSQKMVVPEFHSEEQKAEFESFFKQIRDGEKPSKAMILNVARMFRDDMLLDNLSRPQLSAMAKYMNINSFGTSTILRYQIRHKMRLIKQDDRVIEYEGVDSLNAVELHAAAQSRGFKTIGISTGRLRDDLETWLQLRLHDRVPSTFLILASAYTYGGHDMDSVYDGVLNVLSSLPPEVYHETELELQSDQATNAQRLEVLKEQDDLIREENKEEQESGHVVQVRDNLNVDDDERVPHATSGSEALDKDGQVSYSDKDATKVREHEEQESKSKPVSPTPSEEDAKADVAWYAKADEEHAKKAENHARKESESKAWTHSNEELGSQERPVEPTPSELDAKADKSFYRDADRKNAERHVEEESESQAQSANPTPSELDAKADSTWYAAADKKASEQKK